MDKCTKKETLAISQWLPKIFNQKKPQPKNAPEAP